MVFCGNGDVLKLVNSRQAAIQQISRRLPHREDITCIADDDADLIAGQFGVEGMEAFRLCRRIGNHFHADGIAKVLTVARENVGGHKTTLDLADVKGALALMSHFNTLDANHGQPRRQSSLRPSGRG